MKPSKLAAIMYTDFRTGNPFTAYTDEQIMSSLHMVGEMIVFFSTSRENMIIYGLTQFECHLASVLAIRGRMV